MANYKLSFTKEEIDEKLSKIQDGGIGYTELVEVELIAEQTIEIAMDEEQGFAYGLLEPGCTFSGHSEVTVVWDGVGHICVPNEGDNVGNLSLAGLGEDTGEPFIISGASQGYSIVMGAEGTHTVKVTCKKEQICTIDPKFIPFGALPIVDLETAISLNLGVGTVLSETDGQKFKEAVATGLPCIIKFSSEAADKISAIAFFSNSTYNTPNCVFANTNAYFAVHYYENTGEWILSVLE